MSHPNTLTAQILTQSQFAREVIQDFVPLADSLEWDLGQQYLRQRGNKAFISDSSPVPYVINNDGTLARHAAEVFIASLLEADKHPPHPQPLSPDGARGEMHPHPQTLARREGGAADRLHPERLFSPDAYRASESRDRIILAAKPKSGKTFGFANGRPARTERIGYCFSIRVCDLMIVFSSGNV
jgi:hypothetical protein